MREFLLAIPIIHGEMREGSAYAASEPLPLHCTLMRYFWTNLETSLLKQELDRHAAAFTDQQIVLESDYRALFGAENDVPVHVLCRNKKLNYLRTALLIFLAKQLSAPSEFHWIGACYRPHVTDLGSTMFTPGSRHAVDRFVLVERLIKDKTRVVQSVHELSHQT